MYLRVSVTDRCNLRCRYCLPENAVFAAERAASSELQSLMRLVCEAVPVTKIRLTGGEPTLCPDLIDHVRVARELAPVVGLTTNGVLLAPLLLPLRAAGLTRLNISLDSVEPEQFRRLARRDGLNAVIAAIRAARAAGFTPLKVNCVALNETDVPALVRFAAYEGVHLRFIELMAIGEARPWQATAYLSASVMREHLAAAGITLHEANDLDEPTARVWTIAGEDPAECTIGFITTVSAPFCATCDRIRLSSQGRFYTCLMDNTGHDLLPALRAGHPEIVIDQVRQAVAGKRPPLRFERFQSMAEIGG